MDLGRLGRVHVCMLSFLAFLEVSNFSNPINHQVWCVKNVSSLLIIVGAFLGFTLGFTIRSFWLDIPPVVVNYIGLPGKLLVRAFSMILVPLIVCSLSTSESILSLLS
jgi:hypothetical protein